MFHLLENLNLVILMLVLVVSLITLSKSADYLVDNAVKLSKIWGLPEIVIGATIVSFGTTLPELSASITSSLQGNGGFALGNAVGSIIANTSIILGIGALFGKIPVDRKSSQKLSLFIASALLLILPTIPYKLGSEVGFIPQWMGFVFLILIPVYVYFLINQEKKDKPCEEKEAEKSVVKEAVKSAEKPTERMLVIVIKIFISAFVIAASAAFLVGTAEVLAVRVGIPDIIIASTLVAFGTSVPELSTCIAATKSNHGGLALGNIMGANILNILLVVGAAGALIPGGIAVPQEFYQIHFVALAAVLFIFGIFAYNTKFNKISKREGIILILIYLVYIGANLLSVKSY